MEKVGKQYLSPYYGVLAATDLNLGILLRDDRMKI